MNAVPHTHDDTTSEHSMAQFTPCIPQTCQRLQSHLTDEVSYHVGCRRIDGKLCAIWHLHCNKKLVACTVTNTGDIAAGRARQMGRVADDRQ